jgi:hypothetical protein
VDNDSGDGDDLVMMATTMTAMMTRAMTTAPVLVNNDEAAEQC